LYTAFPAFFSPVPVANATETLNTHTIIANSTLFDLAISNLLDSYFATAENRRSFSTSFS
jgi:hypothetical protein